jgi:hypothetical protein
MIEERDANPTADAPGRFRGRRAPTALTAGGTESSEVVARLSGTESSNPLPSSGELGANSTPWGEGGVRGAVGLGGGAVAVSGAPQSPLGRRRGARPAAEPTHRA